MMHRPVDSTPLDRRTFAMRRQEALKAGVCIRCKEPVDPERLPLIDAAEYHISAMCPTCWDWVMGGPES